MVRIDKNDYVGYEYMKLTVNNSKLSLYIDCYESFGWIVDENYPSKEIQGIVSFQMKRDRKIINKMELTRLQRNFEACLKEIEQLERSKTNMGKIVAMTIGVIGTAFMAGSTFAIVNNPPIVWLCIILAIPGFMGWALPYIVYKILVDKKTMEIKPLIANKYDEIYEICKKGYALLS